MKLFWVIIFFPVSKYFLNTMVFFDKFKFLYQFVRSKPLKTLNSFDSSSIEKKFSIGFLSGFSCSIPYYIKTHKEDNLKNSIPELCFFSLLAGSITGLTFVIVIPVATAVSATYIANKGWSSIKNNKKQ